jgi:hypothetical protein
VGKWLMQNGSNTGGYIDNWQEGRENIQRKLKVCLGSDTIPRDKTEPSIKRSYLAPWTVPASRCRGERIIRLSNEEPRLSATSHSKLMLHVQLPALLLPATRSINPRLRLRRRRTKLEPSLQLHRAFLRFRLLPSTEQSIKFVFTCK